MRFATVVVIAAAALGGRARAQCPSVCLPGGGPGRTDCVIEWSGLPSMTASCVDGTGCDQDGVADGTCTFPLLACINVTGSADCTPGTLAGPPTVKPAKAPPAQALASALGALDPVGHGCTALGIAAPLKVGLPGIKTATSRLKATAVSGGLRDTDKLTLTCQPNPTPPSFSAAVLPILSAKCALPSCHTGPSPSGGQNPEPAHAYADGVGAASTNLLDPLPGEEPAAGRMAGDTGNLSLLDPALELVVVPHQLVEVRTPEAWNVPLERARIRHSPAAERAVAAETGEVAGELCTAGGLGL